ncbi:MAG: hypothetical protein SFT81_07180 [Candidatus Caenarcaniphilales bacterium]|nr:hypothetical protein [Candidatus Caenarcaniphilales bacterium]
MHPNPKDKIIASLSYATYGIMGFVFLLLRLAETRFLKFHAYQSLLLGLLFTFMNYAVSFLGGLVLTILRWIHAPAQIFGIIELALIDYLPKFVFGSSLLIIVYCIWRLWKNEYSNLKWVSDQIHRMF